MFNVGPSEQLVPKKDAHYQQWAKLGFLAARKLMHAAATPPPPSSRCTSNEPGREHGVRRYRCSYEYVPPRWTMLSSAGESAMKRSQTLPAAMDFHRKSRPPKAATALTSQLIRNPGFFGVVAELDGTVIGSNFLDERSTMHGLGPVSVRHYRIARSGAR